MPEWLAFFDAERALEIIAATTAFAYVVYGIISAIRSGAIKSLEGGFSEEEVRRATKEHVVGAQPFEVRALANYYNQALSRANISFWFSLIFASIGFSLIVFALFSYDPADAAGTIIKVISGTVIDGVSALFFVQSTNAQKSMSEFFEKLRLDRLNAEAREMIAEIENSESRDQLRAQLVLKYSGIDRLLEGGGAQPPV